MSGQFDTSGGVLLKQFSEVPADYVFWSDLDPFTQGYVEALWDSKAELHVFAFSDLAPEALARIMEDCDRFIHHNSIERYRKTKVIGAVFWAARQKGKWQAAKFPPLTPTLGEDGKVYLSTPSDVLSCLEVGS